MSLYAVCRRLTPWELAVLRALHKIEHDIPAGLPADRVRDIPAASMPGVIGSLCNKGIYRPTGKGRHALLHLTERGEAITDLLAIKHNW